MGQTQPESEYYLFKKATLKCCPFKRYAEMKDKVAYRCKRPNGTWWMSHQLAAVSIHLHNLHTMVAFSNEQVEAPSNDTMKKEKARIQGFCWFFSNNTTRYHGLCGPF